MPVKKFRSVEEMEGNTWHEPGSRELFRAIRATWEFAERTLRPRFPPGVYKHRSIEGAEKQREEWERANFEAYQERLREQQSKGSVFDIEPHESGKMSGKLDRSELFDEMLER